MISNELHPAEIRRNLKTEKFGNIIVLFDSVDSTNTASTRLAEAGFPEGTVVTASEQVRGRGRKERKWFSNSVDSLVFSMILKPKKLPIGLTSLLAYSIIETLDNFCKGTMMKWPNDIYYKGRKIGGILAEGSNEYMVIGAGLNINQREEDFPNELLLIASSLRIANGNRFDRGVILCRIIEVFERNYKNWENNGFPVFKEAVEARLLYINTDVIITNGNMHKSGELIGITEEGYLLLRCGDEVNVFSSGDLSLRRIKE
ncbi:biotin--[acetyl-CoA-carboxylase] ligase [bacterium]|nr:biotin--[acetyl-CoA-carboxylase] ligase [bacterium]